MSTSTCRPPPPQKKNTIIDQYFEIPPALQMDRWVFNAGVESSSYFKKTPHSLFLPVAYLLSHMGQCWGPAVWSLSLILQPFTIYHCVQGRSCTSTNKLAPEMSILFNPQQRFVRRQWMSSSYQKNTCLGWPLRPPLCLTSCQGWSETLR
jgi:hypothetical protein